MNNQKLLACVNAAIGNLKDSEDGYGTTPVDFMRKNGIKSMDNMVIFKDSVGGYLEEIRQMILADIESSEAKKSGKSSVLSAVKKLAKICYNESNSHRPALAYARYDEAEKKYWMCTRYWLLVAETSDGLNMIPESVQKNAQPFNWKMHVSDIGSQTIALPEIGKLSAYLKQAKAKASKHDRRWDKVILDKCIGVKGEWLELLMKVTGATEIKTKGYGKSMYMEGNGYQAVIMPIQTKEEETVTDFENI